MPSVIFVCRISFDLVAFASVAAVDWWGYFVAELRGVNILHDEYSTIIARNLF